MAAPTESGYGLGVKEDVKTLAIDEVKRQGPKVVGVVEGGEREESKNGSEACPEGDGGEEHGEEQVAKKPRVEKAENGKAGDDGNGVESLEGGVEKEGGAVEGVNGGGVAEEGGEEEVENGAGEEKEKEAGGEDAAPGDGGLRTLLQEGENTKTSVGSHGVDATHMLNGAK